MNGIDSVQYIQGSYKAIGNDGNHFNGSINSGSNSEYPDSIANALYYMSDHLPVVLKTRINYPLTNGLALYRSITSVACNGDNTGSATINANAGVFPYTYQWDAATGNQTTQTATGLVSGSYCVTVTDALMEEDEYCVYISQPSAIISNSFTSASSSNCNGSAAVLISGGVSPYSYNWSVAGVGDVNVADNLCPDSYTCVVTDANGCSISISLLIEDQSLSLN